MNLWEFIVAVVLITTIGRVIQTRYASGQAGIGDRASTDSADAARLRQEVQTLKERIAVLERLATEDTGAKALDRQIEALRDQK